MAPLLKKFLELFSGKLDVAQNAGLPGRRSRPDRNALHAHKIESRQVGALNLKT
jgi:hypothetical protein